jgi:simple sugar transport system permease protein
MNAINTLIIDGMSFGLPLFIMAIGGIYSERSGVTMLATEGLQGFGAFTGALAAFSFAPLLGSNSPALIYIAMICAMIGGALFS